MPGGQPPRRRGAISAEPVTEEDATSYVKKVSNSFSINLVSFGKRRGVLGGRWFSMAPDVTLIIRHHS